MLNRRPTSVAALFLALSLSMAAGAVAANDITRYRYKNSQGVPVISNTLPAQYAQGGYDILDGSNNVIKVVPPAPSKEDVEKVKQQRAVLAKYEVLKRRYSTVDDIERAKKRKLSNINTNISILKGNISNLEAGVDELVRQAAQFERAGRKVPASILSQLDDTKTELDISADLLTYREQEYRDTAKKFDEDVRAFIVGEMLDKRLNPQND